MPDNRKSKYGIGLVIRNYRTKQHITQRILADEIGVSPNTVHLWERGMCRPSVGALIRLSRIMNVPLSELITGCDSRQL